MKKNVLVRHSWLKAALIASAMGAFGFPSAVSAMALGEWDDDDNFPADFAYATETHTPLVCAYYDIANCAHCRNEFAPAIATQKFIDWMKARKLVMWSSGGQGRVTQGKIFAGSGVYKTTGFDANVSSINDLPKVCVYWPKKDGSYVYYHWSPRSSASADNFAQVLIDTIESKISGYSAEPEYTYAGGTFAPTGQLEAEAGLTRYVDIPLARTAAAPATNRLAAGAWATNFTWAAGETNKTVRYPVSEDLAAPATITLHLSDAQAEDKGAQGGTNTIDLVQAVSNSVVNPYWIGERNADTLGWGEWTMDLDAAKTKASRQGGKVIVYFSGVLWCPWCRGLETNLLDKAGFKDYAVSHKLVFVLLDNPHRVSTETAAAVATSPDGAAPTLLRYEVGSNGFSGAGYLSRKMISKADAEAVLLRNHKLGYNDKHGVNYNGVADTVPGYRAYGSYRTGYPSFLILKADGTVGGRFNRSAWGLADGEKWCPLAENMARWDDFIKLSDADGEEANNYIPWTEQSHTLGTSSSAELQVSDTCDVFKLGASGNGKKVVFRQTGATPVPVTFTVTTTNALGETNLVSSTNALTVNFTTSDEAFLTVSAFPEFVSGYTNTFAEAMGGATSSVFTVSFKSSVLLVPQEGEASYAVPAGDSSVTVEFASNEVYRLTGFTSIPAGLAAVDPANGLYRATASGAVDLPAAGGSTVRYAHWVPGTIAFTAASQRVIESAGSCLITVARTNGASGACRVLVSLDTNATTAASSRYSWSDTELEWADGEAGERSATLTLLANTEFEGEQAIGFVLTVPGAGCAAPFAPPTNQTVSVFDTDDPVFAATNYERTVYTKVGCSESFPAYNIRGSGRVTVGRASGSMPPGVALSYAGAGMVALSGTPQATGDYTFSCTITEARPSGSATGPASSFTVHVLDITAANPHYGQALAFTGTPLYATNAAGAALAGTLNLTVSGSGRMTARYYGTARSSVSFSRSGGWTGLDAATGALTAEFPARSGVALRLSMAADGTVTAEMDDPTSLLAAGFSPRIAAELTPALAPAGAYAGYYTVTLPYTNSAVGSPAALVGPAGGGQVAAPSGAGFLTLKMDTPSAVRKGAVRYAGILPNGTAVSGSATLVAGTEPGYAALPIFRRSSRDVLGIVLSIRENAAATHADDPEVVFGAGALGYWAHTQGGFSFIRGCEAYGSYFNPAEPLDGCCEEWYSTTRMSFLVGGDAAASDSPAYGAVSSLPEGASVTVGARTLTLDSKPNGLRLSYSRSTGVFKGSFKIGFSGGRTLTATYRGVLLPGWQDCGCTETPAVTRPFGSGACWFSDRFGGASVKRGMSVDLKPITE